MIRLSRPLSPFSALPCFPARPLLPGPRHIRPHAAQAAAPTVAQLEALAGEYTDPVEPDTPLSFYVQDGKLFYETERNVPTELKPVSAIEFVSPDAKNTFASRSMLPAAAPAVVHSDRAWHPSTTAPARPSITSSTITSAPRR